MMLRDLICPVLTTTAVVAILIAAGFAFLGGRR